MYAAASGGEEKREKVTLCGDWIPKHKDNAETRTPALIYTLTN